MEKIIEILLLGGIIAVAKWVYEQYTYDPNANPDINQEPEQE